MQEGGEPQQNGLKDPRHIIWVWVSFFSFLCIFTALCKKLDSNGLEKKEKKPYSRVCLVL